MLASRRFWLTLTLAVLLAAPLLAQVSWPGNFQKAWVCGRVTADGKPLAGARVMALGDSGMAMTHSAANGNYSLGVGAGKWTVTATHQGFRLQTPAEVTLKGGEANETTHLALVASPAVIHGRVIDEKGRPLPRSAVMAAPFMDLESEEEAEGESDEFQSRMPAQAVADAQGRFVLNLEQGTWLVSASRLNYEMSPKNPPLRLPGMPEGMQMSLPGVVARATAGPGPECVVILRPADRPAKGTSDADTEDSKPVVAQPLVLEGRACPSPGNVLHWTRTRERKSMAGCVVKRSTTPFDGKAPVVEVSQVEGLMGVLQDGEGSVFSWTDTISAPGTTYWYAVQEIGSKGAGPLSKPVRLTTR